MPLKVAIMFNQNQSGWTESYYSPLSSLPDSIPSFDRETLNQSGRFRAPGVDLYAVRYSKVDGSRESKIFYTSGQFNPSNSADPANAPDPVSTTIQVVLRDAALRKRFVQLRGVMDHDVTRRPSGTDFLNAGIYAALGDYFRSMFSYWQIRYKKNPAVDALFYTPVINMQTNVGNANWTDIHVVSLADAGITAGRQLRFKGSVKSQLLGFPANPLVLQTVAPGTATVPYKLQFSPAQPKNLQVVRLAYDYSNITSWQFLRFSERKTGRPFGSLRGKARTAVSRV